MPVLKYWDGAAWQALLSMGGTPSIKSMPPRDQTGAAYEVASVVTTDTNAPYNGVWTVPPGHIEPTPHYQTPRKVWIVSGLYAGQGNQDVGTYHEIVRARDTARMTQVGYPILAHGGYYVPLFTTAVIDAAQGGESPGFYSLVHVIQPSPLHTSGITAWIESAG